MSQGLESRRWLGKVAQAGPLPERRQRRRRPAALLAPGASLRIAERSNGCHRPPVSHGARLAGLPGQSERGATLQARCRQPGAVLPAQQPTNEWQGLDGAVEMSPSIEHRGGRWATRAGHKRTKPRLQCADVHNS